MRVVYYDLNIEFSIKNDVLNVLVVEQPREFEKLVIAFAKRASKKETKIELFEDCECVDFAKKAELIVSPTDMVYEKRDVQKHLLTNLVEEIHSTELVENFGAAFIKFFEVLEGLRQSTEYELDFDESFGAEAFLKSVGVHLKEPEGRFVERFIDYSQNLHRILGKQVFVFISCAQYFQREDFKYLLEHAKYMNISVLFVESRPVDLEFSINQYIIDDDLCELH